MGHHDTHALAEGTTIAVVGGGPAGAFFAIWLLRALRERARSVHVLLFERPHRGPACEGPAPARGYRGCPYCAGGLSPRLCDELDRIGIRLPPELIQAEIRRLTTHAHWKNMTVPVPPGRRMLSVYRGRRPPRRPADDLCLDAYLLDEAISRGAQLIDATVCDAAYAENGKPVLSYRRAHERGSMEVDFVAFAGGINQEPSAFAGDRSSVEILGRLHPPYRPPPSRKALIVEVDVPGDCETLENGELHLLHLHARDLHLEMCSIIPKRGGLTVSLIGASVDAARGPEENLGVIRAFLRHRSVAPLFPGAPEKRLHCICTPRIVTGTARQPVGHRVAAIGDMAASRLYKDGILSAYLSAGALARALLRCGVEGEALGRTYERTLAAFRRDTASGRLVFLLYRAVFSRSALSRMLYQAFTHEIKSEPPTGRRMEGIIWRIASGDDSYPNILRAMLRPATLWVIVWHGGCATLLNLLIEGVFGLSWRTIQRYPTAVRKELVRARRESIAALLERPFRSAGAEPEFERTYTIAVRRDESALFRQLGRLGETDRAWLTPRWVTIRRVGGMPNEPGCIIEYRIFGGLLRFRIELEQLITNRLLVYRVSGSFPDRGLFVFTVEPGCSSNVSIYLAFDYARGSSFAARVFWRLFRLLFPEIIHDVLWNHALCQLKSIAEAPQRPRDSRLCSGA
jgi:flavin-dependent dehydrogenase